MLIFIYSGRARAQYRQHGYDTLLPVMGSAVFHVFGAQRRQPVPLPDALEPRDSALHAFAGEKTTKPAIEQGAFLLEVRAMVGHKRQPAARGQDACEVGHERLGQYVLPPILVL